MLKLKLQYFGQLMQTTDSFEKTLMLGKIEGWTTSWTATRQAFLSIATSQSLLKLMSIELVMPSNYLILCHPLLLPVVLLLLLSCFIRVRLCATP